MSQGPASFDAMITFNNLSNVLLHLQTQAAKRLGRGPCVSKGRDRCGCRVQAIVILPVLKCAPSEYHNESPGTIGRPISLLTICHW
jgi:hypothetical protein